MTDQVAAMLDATTHPAHWRLRRVGDLVSVANGHPFESESFAPNGTLPLVRIRDLMAEEFETYVSGYVPHAVRLRDGDVVVGMDGDFNLVIWKRGPAALNQRLCILRPRSGVDIRFIAYALPRMLKTINELTFSTTVKHLSSSEIRAQRLFCPPLAEQRRIADFLDAEMIRIDTLREITARQMASIGERRVELQRTMTTTAHAPSVVDTGIPWMPRMASGWTLHRVAHVFRTGSGTTPRSDESAYFGLY